MKVSSRASYIICLLLLVRSSSFPPLKNKKTISVSVYCILLHSLWNRTYVRNCMTVADERSLFSKPTKNSLIINLAATPVAAAVDKRLNLSLMPLFFFLFICLLFLALDDAVDDDDDDDDDASSTHLLVLTVLFNPIIKRAEQLEVSLMSLSRSSKRTGLRGCEAADWSSAQSF